MRALALGLGALLFIGCSGEAGDYVGVDGPQGGISQENPPADDPDFFKETGMEPRGDGEVVNNTPSNSPAPAPTVPPASGQLAVTVAEPAPVVRLNETREIAARVTPGAGFTGSITLTVEGLPAGITAKVTPDTATLTGAPLDVRVALTVPSDFAVNPNVPLTLKATGGAATGSAAMALNIPAELLITIPSGVALGTAQAPNQMAFGSPSIPVLLAAGAGTKVTFVNGDKINHQIHANGTAGLAHEPGPLQANGANAYSDTLTAKATVNFRCHIHANMIGQIIVK
ncbi:MAG: hypothetical protein ACT4TC_18710 [Myxococcaceae bacterium]